MSQLPSGRAPICYIAAWTASIACMCFVLFMLCVQGVQEVNRMMRVRSTTAMSGTDPAGCLVLLQQMATCFLPPVFFFDVRLSGLLLGGYAAHALAIYILIYGTFLSPTVRSALITHLWRCAVLLYCRAGSTRCLHPKSESQTATGERFNWFARHWCQTIFRPDTGRSAHSDQYRRSQFDPIRYSTNRKLTKRNFITTGER